MDLSQAAVDQRHNLSQRSVGRLHHYLSDVWGDTAYAIGDVLISALSGLASVWNATLGFMADGWTILTTSVLKGWNSTIGFLKKGFIRLRELVDIAGDVSVQIGGVLINALAGVETAWVETIDYLADTWSVFVAQVNRCGTRPSAFCARPGSS